MAVVAFQGERGAFGEEAVLRYFGEDAQPHPCRTFGDVFMAVSSGRVDYGMVPVENSQAGSIYDNYDLLRQHDVFVVGEINHAVDQNLMALPGQQLSDIKRVISHPQALAQCDVYLRQLGAEMAATYDTAGSAKEIRENGLAGVAAVASLRAAEIYELEVLAPRIQTIKENVTRFAALSRTPRERGEGPHKTMLVMSTAHQAGSLYRALGALAERGINLMKLESRPSRHRNWEYVFYLDIEGHREDPQVREALAELANHTVFCKVFGSFTRDLSTTV